MSQVIPEGWLELPIGEIADVVAGGTPKAGNPDNFAEPGSKIPWLTPADLSKYKSKFIAHGARDLSQEGYDSSSAKLMPKGALLFSSRAPIGYVVIAENPICTNQGFKNFVFTEQVDSIYAFYYLKSIRDLAESLGSGTTFKELSGATAKTIPFCLAPLAEQKVIADKLDELLAQVESTKARLDAIPAILKSFRQSVLAAAVSGKLTEEWRGENTSQLMSIDNVCHTGFDGPFGSKLKTADYTDNGVRVARLENVGHLNFIEEKQTFISENKHKELTRNTLEENDILFSSFVEEEVRVCLFPKHHSTFINKADCFCLRVNNDIALPKFVVYVLASRSSYEQIKSNVQGVTRPRINLKILKSLTFRFPTLKEQTEIVRRVEELFAFADKVEAQVNEAQTRVNNLTQSILAKAFRGELTADWRTANPELIRGENSAESLLKRIKAERAAMGKKSKQAKV